MLIKLAAIAVAVAAAKVQPEQFDLACNAAATVDGAGSWPALTKHFRIDLASNSWCEDDCLVVRPFVDIGPDSLLLDGRRDLYSQRDIINIRTLDRVTGAYLRMDERPSVPILEKAQCTAQDFSGFPLRAHKF